MGTGTIEQIERKIESVGTYKQVTVRQNRQPCRLRAKRQPNHRNLFAAGGPYAGSGFKDFVAQRGGAKLSDEDVEKLYAEFLEWKRRR